MKIAVINFSGNVGKTTIARHLLLPRIDGAELFSVESLNAADGEGHAMRGRQFGELQELLQTMDSAVVDIGASNVEELLDLMQKYQGSHEDFDAFVVPTVPALKQQQDTIATLVELARLGVPRSRVRLVFNMVSSAALLKLNGTSPRIDDNNGPTAAIDGRRLRATRTTLIISHTAVVGFA